MLSSKPRQAPPVLTATTIPIQAADTPPSMEALLFRPWPHQCPSDPTAMPLHRLTSMRHCMMDRGPRCRCTVLMVPGKDCHFFHTAERTGRNRTGPTQINQVDDDSSHSSISKHRSSFHDIMAAFGTAHCLCSNHFVKNQHWTGSRQGFMYCTNSAESPPACRSEIELCQIANTLATTDSRTSIVHTNIMNSTRLFVS